MIYGIASLFYENGVLVDSCIDKLLDTAVNNNGCGEEEIRNCEYDILSDLDDQFRSQYNGDRSKVENVCCSFSVTVDWERNFRYNPERDDEYDVNVGEPELIDFITFPDIKKPKETLVLFPIV